MYPLVNSDASNISTYAERDLLYSLLSQSNAGSDPNSDIFNWLQQSVDAISKQQYQLPQAQTAPIPPDIYENLMKATIPSALGIKREHSSLSSSSDEVPCFKFNPNVFSLQPTVVDISESEAKSNNDTQTPSKKLRAVIEQKEQARAEQQRTASRKYRQKKKQLIEHLESRMKEMEEEKAKIEKERNDTLQVVNKLKEENFKLRKTHAQDSEQVEKDREKLLKELDQLMKGNPTDEEIRPYILRLRDCCQKISVVGECHVNLLISPTVVQQLVKNGFFDTPCFVGDDITEPHGIKAFADKVILYVQSLTEDQKQRIKSHVDEFNQRMETVKAEREQLNKEIAKFFANSQTSIEANESNSDIPQILQAMSTLELLRKNLSDEVKLSEMALFNIVGKVLTVRQQAQFHLEISFQHRSVMNLKQMWMAFRTASQQIS